MTKRYQINEFDTSALAVPEQVSVAMSEIAADMREGLLALAVGAGLQVMTRLMEADVAAACGPRGKHDPERAATRHGTEAGSVTLGGRRVPITRPRVRGTDGTGELAVPAYELFNSTELLGPANGSPRRACHRRCVALESEGWSWFPRSSWSATARSASSSPANTAAGQPSLGWWHVPSRPVPLHGAPLPGRYAP